MVLSISSFFYSQEGRGNGAFQMGRKREGKDKLLEIDNIFVFFPPKNLAPVFALKKLLKLLLFSRKFGWRTRREHRSPPRLHSLNKGIFIEFPPGFSTWDELMDPQNCWHKRSRFLCNGARGAALGVAAAELRKQAMIRHSGAEMKEHFFLKTKDGS